jgi:hypothetical protein
VIGVVKWYFFIGFQKIDFSNGSGPPNFSKNTENALLSQEHFRFTFAAVGSRVALHAET